MTPEDAALVEALLNSPPFVIVPSKDTVRDYHGQQSPRSYRTADALGNMHDWFHEFATVGDAYQRDDGAYYVHGWTYWQSVAPGPLFNGPVAAIESCILHELCASNRPQSHSYAAGPFDNVWHAYQRRALGFDEDGWKRLPDTYEPPAGEIVRIGDHGGDRYEHEWGGRVWADGRGTWGWMERSGMSSVLVGEPARSLDDAKRLALGRLA